MKQLLHLLLPAKAVLHKSYHRYWGYEDRLPFCSLLSLFKASFLLFFKLLFLDRKQISYLAYFQASIKALYLCQFHFAHYLYPSQFCFSLATFRFIIAMLSIDPLALLFLSLVLSFPALNFDSQIWINQWASLFFIHPIKKWIIR